MNIRTLSMVAVALMLGHNAAADDDFWVGVKAGTLGLGVEAAWRPVPYLDIRGGGNFFSLDEDSSEAGIDYDGELDLQTFYATANLRVPLSPFRVTAGIFSNGNEIKLTSRDTGMITVGNTTYPAAAVGQLQVKGDFDNIAPYFGIGFDFRIFNTLGLIIDAGVLRQGSINIGVTANGALANDPAFQAELEAERMELQNEVDDYDIYPVVSIGLSFNF
ncbi:MAG: hypothetical protein HKN70_06415 [Gammaproteobacteria bacterium]|nr:hypothetical protein [Gammaproteobacteria bacterium]